MHQISLRVPFLASVSLGTLLLSASAQSQTVVPQAEPAPGNGAAAAPKNGKGDGDLAGLPTFLLLVPGGTVEVGLDSNRFLDAASQVVSPRKPEAAATISPAKLTEAMRRTSSALGKRKVDVAPFLLAKWNVKCSEWDVFLQAARKAGRKMRPPFGWWRFGRQDHYNEKLPEINQEFPGDKTGPLLFWERHGADFPYALKDEKGRPIDEQPVTYISWREANDFAASLGMRLPNEFEWMRAARGDGTNIWPCADPKNPATDAFSDEVLKKLQIFSSREQVLKATGTVQAASGPFGHLDMFGQVWQLIGDIGYRPVHGVDAFSEEWKRLQKDKTGALLQSPPAWKDDRVIAKGGSYLSAGEPIQLLLDGRAPVQTIDVLESLGMRLAKSLRPGYDALFSALRGSYNRQPFAIDQDVDLAAQAGTERYELAANGFPTEYDAVTLAPVNWLAKEKNAELQKLVERSQTSPLLVGTLYSTMPLAEANAPAGIYSLLYRKEGLPRELVEAIKQGHRELAAAAKAKPGKGDDQGEGAEGDKKDPKKDEKNDKKKEKTSWRDLVARFGLTDKDLESKDAADGDLKFIRMDGIEVSTDRDVFLLHGNEGKIVGVLPTTNAKPAMAAAFPSTSVLEADAKGKAVAKLHFGVPLTLGNSKKVVDIHLNLALDFAAPTADKPWRNTP